MWCLLQWLTQGRNSCPLCRGQGVDEKEKVEDGSSTPGGSAFTPDSTSRSGSMDTGPGAAAAASDESSFVEVERAS